MIAIDPMGNAAAIWGRTTGKKATGDIWAAFYNHSLRSWSAPLKISNGGSAANARVAIDNEGNALFIWDEGFPTQILSRTLSAQGVWNPDLSTAATFVDASTHAQTAAQISLDSAGNALVIWMEYFDGSNHICSAKKPLHLDWTTLGEISSGDFDATLTPTKALAMNSSSNAIAVWEENHTSFSEVHAAEYTQGNWSVPIAISAEPGKNARQPIAGIDENNRSTIVWSQDAVIQAKRISDPAPMTISDPTYPSIRPDLGVDAMGNAVVVFERSNGMHKFISASSLSAHSTQWSAPIDISGPSLAEATGAGYPILSINPIGDGIAIWKEYAEERLVIQGAGYSLNTWSLTKPLSFAYENAGRPLPAYDMAIAVNVAGNIMAVWPEDPNGTGSYQIKATAGVGLANAGPTPPLADPETLFCGIVSGKQTVRRFPAHSDIINTLIWTPSEGAASYKIYRNNLASLIGSIKATRYEDHQRPPKTQETYLITAVDAHGQESSPMTIVIRP
jgi:hypothetical protein